MTLQVSGFLDQSTVNGIGLRSVLFVSGCHHACPGCQNEAMQNIHYGESVPIEEILRRIQKNKPLIDGVTFSGGEPFEQCEVLSMLARLIKAEGLNIWCYSGYTYAQLQQSTAKHALLNLVDVLVDGPYIEGLSDSELKYRGSSNQHIYRLENGNIIECLDDLLK